MTESPHFLTPLLNRVKTPQQLVCPTVANRINPASRVRLHLAIHGPVESAAIFEQDHIFNSAPVKVSDIAPQPLQIQRKRRCRTGVSTKAATLSNSRRSALDGRCSLWEPCDVRHLSRLPTSTHRGRGREWTEGTDDDRAPHQATASKAY